MKTLLRAALCGTVALTTGCYSFALASPDALAPGADVRVSVSDAEARRLAPVLGREDRRLHGELVGRDAGSLLLQVRGAGSTAERALYQRVTLPPAGVDLVEVRRLDVWRSLGVATVFAAGLAYAALRLSGENGSTGAEPPGPDAIRLPLWTVP